MDNYEEEDFSMQQGFQYPNANASINESTNMAALSQDLSNFLIYCIETSEIVNELKHQLKNEIYDKDTGAYLALGDPLLNDKGISNLLSIIRPMVDKTITLSSYDNKQINNKMQEFGYNIIRLLARHYNEYGIPNLIVASNIRVLICNLVHSSLLKAKGGLTLGIIGKTSKRTEQITPQKQGWKALLPSI